jgi:hypothetical protein
MAQGTLLPNLSEVRLACLRPKDGAIQMELQACRTSSSCPACGSMSRRVHSRYLRRLGDLPLGGTTGSDSALYAEVRDTCKKWSQGCLERKWLRIEGIGQVLHVESKPAELANLLSHIHLR